MTNKLFSVRSSTEGNSRILARTGTLLLPKVGQVLTTPALLTPSTRGTLPNLTPDNVKNVTNIKAIQVSVECFMGKLPSVPFLKYPGDIREIFCLEDDMIMVLTPRASNAEPSNRANCDDAIEMKTVEGFRKLPIKNFIEFAQRFNPDILVCPLDLPDSGSGAFPGNNRIKKLVHRSRCWLNDIIEKVDTTNDTQIFVSVLPTVNPFYQKEYFSFINQNLESIKGLNFHPNISVLFSDDKDNVESSEFNLSKPCGLTPRDPASYVEAVSKFSNVAMDDLLELPRYVSSACTLPHHILKLVSQGYDLFNDDISVAYANAGVALDFTFPAPPFANDKERNFGISLWKKMYRIDMTSVHCHSTDVLGTHKKAYIHHLLNAKEMTSAVLLTIHNTRVMEDFFEGIRRTVDNNTFEQEMKRFFQIYSGDNDGVKLLRESRDIVPVASAFVLDRPPTRKLIAFYNDDLLWKKNNK
ncbi:tRNA-guanine transglycosylase [Nadsonia fulvescens var. elongata DSM 6958]|uniref:tRNA-guanine transglycosylase n=1 Tax=Nadsonia fulvescens var. elongata DSM 6958 TaxID=857566 RepID=A0A1E3PRN5_9ASCO|nr:tRNA-guanine transglycosylase [Nadsonia fulvescens var. elongata DSM 6958]